MKKVIIREEVCIGCHLCEVYCRSRRYPGGDLARAYRASSAPPRLRVDECGAVSLSVRCQHCDDAPCVLACLTGALYREPVSGLVTVDEERCIACGTCSLVCPVGAPRLDTQRKVMVKCDLCQGEEFPACVAGCPNEALQYADG